MTNRIGDDKGFLPEINANKKEVTDDEEVNPSINMAMAQPTINKVVPMAPPDKEAKEVTEIDTGRAETAKIASIIEVATRSES